MKYDDEEDDPFIDVYSLLNSVTYLCNKEVVIFCYNYDTYSNIIVCISKNLELYGS